MGADPPAACHRPVDHRDGAAVARLDHVAGALAGAHRRHQLGAIGLGITGERAFRDPILQDIHEGAPVLQELGRKVIHLGVARVVELEPLVAVVEAQTLRHVIERRRQQRLPAAQPHIPDGERGGAGHRRDQGDQHQALPAQALPALESREHLIVPGNSLR